MTIGEISYDLVMELDMGFVEGTYRLPEGEWQVFIFSRRDVLLTHVEHVSWESGVSGVQVLYPMDQPLNRASVERLLSNALDVEQWKQVRGPDSMQLR